jgi:signal transduction histidine kinase
MSSTPVDQGLREVPELRFGLMDSAFLVLRIVVLFGGLGWVYFAPLTPDQKIKALYVFLFYSFYVSALYVTIFFHLEHIRAFYLVGLFFDLIFIFLLLMLTGGVASSFFTAFYLLVALHSFYYGLIVGFFVSVASSLIYFVSYVDSGFAMHWTDFAIRILFMFMLALIAGLLSEKMERDRKRIALLNQELRESMENLKRVQNKLIESTKLTALGRMTSDVAHEIRNPLVSIGGFARKFVNKTDPDSPERRYANIIVHEVERLERILRDLLTFTRGPARGIKEIKIRKLVERCLLMRGEEITEKSIRTACELADTLPLIEGDEEQLEQVLLNLIGNAVQAMEPKGLLTLRAYPLERDGQSLVGIDVQDNGPGIPEEIRDRIFNPFFSTKNEGKGTGLGLTVSRRIAEEHGGRIMVESELLKGSTFTIELPVHQNENTGIESREESVQ